MDEEISQSEVQCCPTCGHAVVVRGSITRYYVPISDAKLKELGLVQIEIPEQIQSKKTGI